MKNIAYLLGILLFIACHDDNGNYDYIDVNRVQLRLDAVYGYRIKDTVVEIKPELSQTLSQNKEKMKFVWLHSTITPNMYVISSGALYSDTDTLSHSETLSFPISKDTKTYTHYIRLNVYDSITGLEYAAGTTIKLVKPYHGSWMVLHRQDDMTKLGTVEYIGDKMVVQNDSYHKETGKRLQGKPISLFGIDRINYSLYRGYANLLGIFTDIPQESGVYYQWEKFRQADSMSRSVAPIYRATFNYSQYDFFWGFGNDYGFGCISDGVYYQSPSATKYYKAHIDPALGNTYISHCAKAGFLSVLYDNAGKRFLHYYSPNRNPQYEALIFNEDRDNPINDMIRLIPIRKGLNTPKADPSNIDPAQKVLYIGTGYKYNASRNNCTYAYAVAVEADSCLVYEFASYGIANPSEASFSGYYGMPSIPGLNENSCFASSEDYSGILFYTSGNKVYRLDFKQSGGNATLIYSHPEGKAVKMRFARNTASEQDYSGYEFPLKKSLGIAFEMPDGTGEMVILNLNASGRIGENSTTWEAKQVHKGFGKIKDFVFI